MAAKKIKAHKPAADPETNTLTVNDAEPGDFEALQAVTTELTPEQTIAACQSIGDLLRWPGDRELYAPELRARARELLGKA